MTWASYAFQMPDQTFYNMLRSSVFKCFAIQTGMVNNRLPICLLYYRETHLLAHKMSLFADSTVSSHLQVLQVFGLQKPKLSTKHEHRAGVTM